MANINAIKLRDQIEQDRNEAHEEIDRKFNVLLTAVQEAYEVGNLSRPQAPRKPRMLNIVSATPSVNGPTITPVVGEITNPSSVLNEPQLTEQQSWEQSEDFQSLAKEIVAMLKAVNPEGLPMKEIIEKTHRVESVVRDVVRYLLENRKARKEGQKRGTKYHYNPFGVESDDTDVDEDSNESSDESPNADPEDDDAV